jgi:hypothetical protein
MTVTAGVGLIAANESNSFCLVTELDRWALKYIRVLLRVFEAAGGVSTVVT